LVVGTAQQGEWLSEDAPRSRWRIPATLQGLLAFAVYAAVWLPTVVGPLVGHPSRAQLLQTSPDPNFYVWSLRWWPYAVAHGLNPLYTTQIAAPAGHSLAWVTTVPPLALLATPLTLTAGPVVAFNLLTALALPLSGWAAFLVCRRLTRTFWPALVGGAVYGFSAYEISHVGSGQLNMAYALLPPILAYLVVAWHDGSINSPVLVILAGLVIATQFYLFLETFADLTAILLLSLLMGVAAARRRERRKVLKLAGLLGLAYLIGLALASPYLAGALSTAPPVAPRTGAMDLASLWLPRVGRNLGIGWLTSAEHHLPGVSSACSVGIPLLAVLLALAVRSWRSRLVWVLAGLLVVITVGALGPVMFLNGRPEITLPWHGLFGLPFVRNAYPTRLMLFAFLALAVVTALWLAGRTNLKGRSRWRMAWSLAGRWSLGVLVVAFVVLNASGPFLIGPQSTIPEFVTSGQYRGYLTPNEIVMVVSNTGNAGMLWQADTGYYWRLDGGFINEGFEHRSDLPRAAQVLQWPTPGRIDQFEQLIRTDHIGAIVVDAGHAPAWAGLLGIFGLTGHKTGGVVVYPTDDCQTCHGTTRAEIANAFPAAFSEPTAET
jgi:hypothetical protein